MLQPRILVDLQSICLSCGMLETVDPILRFAGDITDARQNPMSPRGQHAAEWDSYSSLLRGARKSLILPTHLPWLDIRGNHDAFNVPFLGHPKDYFQPSRLSAALQADNDTHYLYDVNTS